MEASVQSESPLGLRELQVLQDPAAMLAYNELSAQVGGISLSADLCAALRAQAHRFQARMVQRVRAGPDWIGPQAVVRRYSPACVQGPGALLY